MVKYMAVAVAVAVAVSGGGAVAVAGLTKRFFNHIQKDFLINVWGIILHSRMMCRMMRTYHPIILQARRGIYQSEVFLETFRQLTSSTTSSPS